VFVGGKQRDVFCHLKSLCVRLKKHSTYIVIGYIFLITEGHFVLMASRSLPVFISFWVDYYGALSRVAITKSIRKDSLSQVSSASRPHAIDELTLSSKPSASCPCRHDVSCGNSIKKNHGEN